MNRRNIVFALCAVLGFIADQATKAWIVSNVALNTGEVPVIDGFFSLVHVKNPGALFGLGADFAYGTVVFLIFTVVALFVIADMFRRLPEDDWFMASALGLVLSGALGNGLDRVRIGVVTDFLRFYSDTPSVVDFFAGLGLRAEYPSFNVADMALVIGIGMFVIHYIFIERREEKAAETADAAAAE
ncbi:MAG: signal peptidase II [Myxococcota bacterium]